MKIMRDAWVWYRMFQKRLLKRWSFVIVLLLIPVSVLAMGVAMRGESGVLTVALCAENPSDALAQEMMDVFLSDDGIIRFRSAQTVSEAQQMVENKEADAAWIFSDRMSEKLQKFTSEAGDQEPLIRILEREDNISLQLSREMMFGKLYPYFSYGMYTNFVQTEITTKELSDSLLRTVYTGNDHRADIIAIEYLNEGYVADNAAVNYLNAPLRGLLSLLVMLGGLASAMYFLDDQEKGRYDWLPWQKRIFPAFGMCLSAVTLTSVVVLGAIFLSGTRSVLWVEFLSMFLYILMASGFCLLTALLFRSAGKLGATLPFFIIVMLSICPIFFNMKILPWVRILLPPNLYLHAVNEPKYLIYSVFYILCVYALAIICNRFRKQKAG